MAFGDIIKPSASRRLDIAIQNRLDAVTATRKTLAAFLKSLEFRVDGGSDLDTIFSLKEVYEDWPKPDDVIAYPSASIIESSPTTHDAHNFTSSPLEETLGEFDHFIGLQPGQNATCLWKESEALCTFQVDFWTDTKADRVAIAAHLPESFSPDSGRSGVMVEGPELYYSRPVRLTLEPSTIFDDSAATSIRGELRLRCLIRAECDIVSLRMATVMDAPRVGIDVTDPTDSPEEE